MSKQASMKMIGVFVVGAVVLLTAAVVIFSSGQFFKKQQNFYALYFDESVRGLNTGAPVYFKGVKVGAVTDVRLYYKPEIEALHSAVVIELDPSRVINLGTGRKETAEAGDIKYLVEKKGLKGQLDIQSLVTGLLVITLDFYPDKPMDLHNYMKQYEEIPTIPTQFEQLTKALQDLPLKDMVQKLDKIISGIEGLVNSKDAKEGVKSLAKTAKEAEGLIKKMNEQIGPAITDLRATSEAARGTFRQAEKTLAMNEGVPGQIAAKAKDTLDQAKGTLKKMDDSLAALNRFTQENTEVSFQLEDTLREFSNIARSLRALTDYLERHPEALLKGKKGP
ncbi:MAG: MlaD family protein [Syntrophales bacterium]|nr:MlaD family protein [Syntrophales bacterium]